ncbi:flagellar motor switch protein FliM [Desulfopila inferna]|uniref:flagellar motor switch protein FliM n=1 Tax=Desulfopila inferna TaxID=468528 RepID=UPI001964FC87|nr:FliM/FliN family flagellar motor switch protein [Desulfopila inferna]MBM9602981.1 FliM/FliN family flagellar motor switch protein [Desulfopila inferna]
MEAILSKKEIADLLKAIKQGQVSLDLDKNGRKHFTKDCIPLNLFQANTFSDELSRLANFDIILDNFCQNLAITLTNNLQRTFSISRSQIDSSHFLDFLLENKDVGAIAVLDISPLKHGALLLVDSHMCFSMVEIILGASTEIELIQPNRKLTSIELNIIQSIMLKGCDDLDRAFAPLINLKTSLIKVESNSRMVSITDADAEILIGTFEVRVGDQTGEMKIVFPLSTIDPLREGLKDLLNVNKAKQGIWTKVLEQEAYNIYSELIAQSGTISMSVGDVLEMKKGDTLFLDYNLNSPLKVLVENKHKFFAIPGTHNGKKAINITGVKDQGA